MAREYVEQRDGGYYLAGSRVPLDAVVYEFQNGAPPEAIRQSFPTLTLEQVYGGITFYLANREEVETAMRESDRLWEEFRVTHPTPPDLKVKLERAREQMSRPG